MIKTALVTGGSGGIGSAIVKKLTEEGWYCAFSWNRGKERAERLAEETGALAIQGDLTRGEDAARIAAQARERMGVVTLLVNNAGIGEHRLFTEIAEADWDRLFAVNVKGAYLMARELLPQMLERRQGSIVNISSIWGESGAAMEVCYSAAKAALIGMTKALAKEVGPSGVRVNCVTPGVITTAMNSAYSPEEMAALQEETPLMRIGRPEDVAEAVAYLAAEKSSFVTGQVLRVDGGFLL